MWTINSRHNKPKKVNTPTMSYIVIALSLLLDIFYLTNHTRLYIMANYACSTEDIVAIKLIMSEPRKSNLWKQMMPNCPMMT
jgi:hypothetical protein